MCDTNESSVYCETVSSNSSVRQRMEFKTEDSSDMLQLYKCEQCGHLNALTNSSEDGFFDNSQSIEISHGGASAFAVSIDPESMQLKNNLLPSQSMSGNQGNHSGIESSKRAKFIRYPGDVGDNEKLDDATTQQYLSLLRKKVMEKSKLTRALTQQKFD